MSIQKKFLEKINCLSVNFDFKNLDKSYKDFLNETIKSFSTKKNEDCRIYIRPSGTEPKIKFYISVNESLESNEGWYTCLLYTSDAADE